ncbi:LytR/AlgR family response regulator transcription factor [Flavobacterium caeni]|uniref:Two component transcriptional regulator, LytTR family n=1 Tax=Flavobacterium caeni TaxID=490189 RepID=A0A1G5H3W6_9FLAO|nr:LytTR family DNA-binding domain-containing protein [Flavobacterium caeni]SCY58361.1 two component transcriptional regulator, LytTR family [Flavobacterium caeni]
MKHSYVIVDDNPHSVLKTQAIAARFQDLVFVGAAHNFEDALDVILEHKPAIVFLEINPEDTTSKLSLSLVSELYRYLRQVPKIIVTTQDKSLAYDAIKYEVLDYCIKPLTNSDLRKAFLRFELGFAQQVDTSAPVAESAASTVPAATTGVKDYPFIVDEPEDAPIEDASHIAVIDAIVDVAEEMPMTELIVDEPSLVVESAKDDKPLIICVKSYGDYRFIEANDICYLQADNNSTDIHLYNGEMITAFKTLKHFETVLSSPFVRIHNSYIVNIDYVSRIHTGNSVCYIKGTTTKLPFSKSYKENVDAIISSITNGNYLEI